MASARARGFPALIFVPIASVSIKARKSPTAQLIIGKPAAKYEKALLLKASEEKFMGSSPISDRVSTARI